MQRVVTTGSVASCCMNEASLTAKSATQRLREFHQRLAQKGAPSLTVTVDRDTASRLRAIAQEHKRSMGKVIRLGSLLSQRALSGTTATAAE